MMILLLGCCDHKHQDVFYLDLALLAAVIRGTPPYMNTLSSAFPAAALLLTV